LQGQTGTKEASAPVTVAGNRLASIQYLRAAAALMVVGYHVIGEAGVIGAAGVDVFFVISGFVIGLITTGRRVHPLAFAYDRAARILPLYWLFTALLVATKLAAPGLLPRLPLDSEWIARSFLLIPTLMPGTTGAFPFLYQGWTLWYEALFYVAAAAAIVLAPQRQAAVLTAMLAVLVVTGMVLQPQGVVGATYTDPLLIEFLVGYWFAVWRAAGGRFAPSASVALIAAGIAGLIVAAFGAGAPEGWPRILIWGLPAMALVIGAISLDDSGRIGEWTLPRLLGDASYAIYLSHGIAVSMVLLFWRLTGMPLTNPTGQPTLALATFALATAAGIAVHLVVERPMMAWFRVTKARVFAPVEKPVAGSAG
jgi:exopolysaccharide production protein ExoZ